MPRVIPQEFRSIPSNTTWSDYRKKLYAAGVHATGMQPNQSAFFEVGFSKSQKSFIIRLDDPQKVEHARHILSGQETHKLHISGRIAKGREFYNPLWCYYLKSDSIEFFEVSTEVCDGAPDAIEDHLDEPQSLFPPGSAWCPWASHIIREVNFYCP
jgi:hypothetical protein